MKYLLSLLMITNLLNASMLLDSHSICIEDYFIHNGRTYVLDSASSNWMYTTDTNLINSIIYNYSYDSSTGRCNPDISTKMGLTIEQFNFLLALIGLVFGAVFMFFTTQIFMNVGGKK